MNTTTCKCSSCDTIVTDGANGNIDQPPPWDETGEVSAYCWECENKALDAAEMYQVNASVEAAARAGRLDLI
jgi:hypothetical protein